MRSSHPSAPRSMAARRLGISLPAEDVWPVMYLLRRPGSSRGGACRSLYLRRDAALDSVGYKFHLLHLLADLEQDPARLCDHRGVHHLAVQVNTPVPAATAARMASITCRAWATSSSSGV